MYSLYIDTHYTNLVIALFNNSKLVDKIELESKEHSSNTVNLINDILTKNNISVDDLKEVIVVIGPGSFTGVRIGVVIAKIIGYPKNIVVKPISFLEFLSLNYDKEVTLGIKDKNGAFIGTFNENHELLEDYFYLTNKELESFDKDIIYSDKVDYDKLISYSNKIESINPHLLKPLYVKKIEVLK